MPDTRPDPEALLRRMQADGTAPRVEGRLKVFLGASPGVGKTYEMLLQAIELKKQGVDVVAGYVEPHGRADTEGMLAGFELVPFREIDYKGIKLREFDLDATRARKPALVLVDELAHTNAESSRHAKRWQDVLELLRHGIDVYTTVNIQHVESLRDVVAQITGVIVRESVPDSVLERAEKIELVDVPTDELLKRMADGKVYVPAQASAATQNFFRKGNLIALRQLALRYVADRVDAQMNVYRQADAGAAMWATRDRIVVCVSPHAAASARLIRATKRIATRLGAPWFAVHVEPPTGLSDGDRAGVQGAFALAETLGGETVSLASDRVVDEVLAFARKENVTRIVVGPPTRSRWRQAIGRGSFVDALVRGAGGIEVLVTTGDDGAAAPSRTRLIARSSPWAYAAAAGAVATVVVVNEVLFDFELVNVAMMLLAAIVLVAARLGRGPSLLATFLSAGAFNFFFVPPRYTFAIESEYLVSFAVMIAVALMIGSLTVRVQAAAQAARVRERRTDALYRLGRDLVAVSQTSEVLKRGLARIAETFDAHVVALLPNEEGRLTSVLAHGGSARLDAKEQAVASWTFENGRIAGRKTTTLPLADGLYVPIAAADRTLGVFALFQSGERAALTPDAQHLLDSFVNQIALALLRSDLSAWIGARPAAQTAGAGR